MKRNIYNLEDSKDSFLRKDFCGIWEKQRNKRRRDSLISIFISSIISGFLTRLALSGFHSPQRARRGPPQPLARVSTLYIVFQLPRYSLRVPKFKQEKSIKDSRRFFVWSRTSAKNLFDGRSDVFGVCLWRGWKDRGQASGSRGLPVLWRDDSSYGRGERMEILLPPFLFQEQAQVLVYRLRQTSHRAIGPALPCPAPAWAQLEIHDQIIPVNYKCFFPSLLRSHLWFFV